MDLHLGAVVDPATGERGADLRYDASHLTTHGVILGMTGSGKTGLGVVVLEEALRAGVPVLVIDPKGDMTNLMLTFPELEADDFAPWLDPSAALEGETAEVVANRWREGLAGWGLGPADIADLRASADLTVYTPGSTAGVPLDVVGGLAPPDLSWDDDAETIRAEIQGLAAGLLGLVDVDADPISSPAHILLCNLVEHGWRAGTVIDLATLLGWIQRPPLRRLGVFDVESFYPESERRELAMRLNGLLASPAFAAWMEGPPLDIASMLWKDGMPRGAIVTLSHLSDAERQFVVTLLLSRLVTWMRTQPGSGSLRVLTYMDEVFGYCPPTAMPPAKQPLLTLMKQARAFGVGMLLATQNPVDLDYKAMSNAGTWVIGRLQTERDKERVVEGLRAASGDVDVAALDHAISGLPKRTFVLHDIRQPPPLTFTSRWAMSYLRGPLTRDEIARLGQAAQAPPPAPRANGEAAAPAMPPVAAGIPIGHLDPAAPWAARVGGDALGSRYRAAVTIRLRARYDETKAGLSHDEEWEAVIFPVTTSPDPATDLQRVDHDPRDRLSDPPRTVPYALPEAPIDSAAWYRSLEKAVVDHVHRTATLTVQRNAALGLWSRPGESADEFAVRCVAAADERAAGDAAQLRDRYEQRLQRLRHSLDDAVDKAEGAAERVHAEQQGDLLEQAGAVIDLLAGRGSARRIGATTRRGRQAEERLRAAEDRVEDHAASIAEMEVELAAELGAIASRWSDRAGEVADVEIGLERDDIDVAETALVWVLSGGD